MMKLTGWAKLHQTNCGCVCALAAGQASQPPASTVPESTAAAATQGSAAPASSAAKPTPGKHASYAP